MVSLLDIADIGKKVNIRGHEIEVRAITGEGLAHLLLEFPELRKVWTKRDSGEEITAADIASLAPRAVAHIIAAGVGSPGQAEFIEKARKLPVGEQIELLAAIVSLSLPQGIRGFIEALEDLALEVGVSGWDPATRSPEPSQN